MSREQFRGHYALGLFGIAITSPTRALVDVNDEICTILGYERAELLTKSWVELTHPDDLHADLTQFNRVMAGEIHNYAIEKRWLRKDGGVIDSMISVNALRGVDGSADHFVAQLQDLTERRRAERALRQANDTLQQRLTECTEELSRVNEKRRTALAEHQRAEERLHDYEQCVEGLEEQIAVMDRDYRYLLANRAFLTCRGLKRDELIGRRAADVLDPSVYEPAIKPRLDECFRGTIVEYELKYVYPTLGERDLFITYFPIAGPQGVDRVAAVLRDVTDKKHAERERSRLQHRLLTAHEDERRRIAREIHHRFGGPIAELNLKIAALRSHCTDNRALADHVQDLEHAAHALDRDLDFLVWEIRPAALRDIGLLTALSEYVKQWSEHVNIQVELLCNGPEGPRVSEEIDTVLYVAAQEALTNIARHASAEHVSIILERRTDTVSLIIEDDGCGFDADSVFVQERGLGLPGIRERARLVGGTLNVESVPYRGTTIVIRIPVQPIHAGEQEHG